MRELRDELPRLRDRLAELRRHLDLAAKQARLEELGLVASDPELWNDRERAERTLREQRELEKSVSFFGESERLASDAEVLLEMASESPDDDTLNEAASALAQLAARLEEAELARMLSGEHDALDAIVSINAGAGGTESQDWAEMLLRMYLRWCERHGYAVEIVDIQPGEEAGIKGVTFTVKGQYAYGRLRSEIGIHRLVRISPFDAQKRRHTSFASVSMIPDIGDDIEVDLDEKDLRIDTYRAGGAGGQHVNKTDSAVRLTHLPTGIVVQCQNERSQHKNKAQAMKILRAKLYEKARLEHEAEIERVAGEKKKIDFGSQIRSYTLHPSQRVKDHRTDVEIGNASAVLDGDLDELMRAYLLSGAK
ncbi:MAG TPA: peptide chain release factor 2 [Myxococcota bacterium]|nr:peptide chain release factor 2 [Myxococcota bacterium]